MFSSKSSNFTYISINIGGCSLFALHRFAISIHTFAFTSFIDDSPFSRANIESRAASRCMASETHRISSIFEEIAREWLRNDRSKGNKRNFVGCGRSVNLRGNFECRGRLSRLTISGSRSPIDKKTQGQCAMVGDSVS